MAECGICGKRESKMLAVVEGIVLTVCSDCSQYGKVVEVKEEPRIKTQVKKSYSEIEEFIVKDYAMKIQKARERLQLTQKELAQKINEKESLIHHVESGKLEPSFDVARKIERMLKITLIELQEGEEKKNTNFKDSSLTLGDLLPKS